MLAELCRNGFGEFEALLSVGGVNPSVHGDNCASLTGGDDLSLGGHCDVGGVEWVRLENK